MARKDRGSAGAWFPRWFWPSFATPAIVWLLLFFVLPFYVILSVAFGGLDQIFLTATPVYNPLHWTFGPFREVVSGLVTTDTIYQETFVRTLVYVGIATALCLLIGYPVAYFIARHAGRAKTFFLVAFIAPFWISYMMRMFAWVNLLQPEGYVNRILHALGVIDEPRAVAERQAVDRDPGAGLRLHPVHDPAAVRHARPHRRRHAGGRARPGRQPGADVLPGDAAAVAPGDPGRVRDRGAADVRRLLHADAPGQHAADGHVRQPDRQLHGQLAREHRARRS